MTQASTPPVTKVGAQFKDVVGRSEDKVSCTHPMPSLTTFVMANWPAQFHFAGPQI